MSDLPLGVPVGVPHASVISIHYIVDGYMNTEASRTPTGTPNGSMCAVPFFDPLEAEFEKVVLTKCVTFAMVYHAVFENLKKSIILSIIYTTIF